MGARKSKKQKARRKANQTRGADAAKSVARPTRTPGSPLSKLPEAVLAASDAFILKVLAAKSPGLKRKPESSLNQFLPGRLFVRGKFALDTIKFSYKGDSGGVAEEFPFEDAGHVVYMVVSDSQDTCPALCGLFLVEYGQSLGHSLWATDDETSPQHSTWLYRDRMCSEDTSDGESLGGSLFSTDSISIASDSTEKGIESNKDYTEENQQLHTFQSLLMLQNLVQDYCLQLVLAKRTELEYYQLVSSLAIKESRYLELLTSVQDNERSLPASTESRRSYLELILRNNKREIESLILVLNALRYERDKIKSQFDLSKKILHGMKLQVVEEACQYRYSSPSGRQNRIILRHFKRKYEVSVDDDDCLILSALPNLTVSYAAALLSKYGPPAESFIIVDQNGQARPLDEPFIGTTSDCELMISFLPKGVHEPTLRCVRRDVAETLAKLDADIVRIGCKMTLEDEYSSLVVITRSESSDINSIKRKIGGSVYHSELFSLPFDFEVMSNFNLNDN